MKNRFTAVFVNHKSMSKVCRNIDFNDITPPWLTSMDRLSKEPWICVLVITSHFKWFGIIHLWLQSTDWGIVPLTSTAIQHPVFSLCNIDDNEEPILPTHNVPLSLCQCLQLEASNWAHGISSHLLILHGGVGWDWNWDYHSTECWMWGKWAIEENINRGWDCFVSRQRLNGPK